MELGNNEQTRGDHDDIQLPSARAEENEAEVFSAAVMPESPAYRYSGANVLGTSPARNTSARYIRCAVTILLRLRLIVRDLCRASFN